MTPLSWSLCIHPSSLQPHWHAPKAAGLQGWSQVSSLWVSQVSEAPTQSFSHKQEPWEQRHKYSSCLSCCYQHLPSFLVVCMSVACLKNATTQAVAPSGAFGDPLSLHAVGDSILSPQTCVVKLSSSKSASSQAILALFTGMTQSFPVTSSWQSWCTVLSKPRLKERRTTPCILGVDPRISLPMQSCFRSPYLAQKHQHRPSCKFKL